MGRSYRARSLPVEDDASWRKPGTPRAEPPHPREPSWQAGTSPVVDRQHGHPCSSTSRDGRGPLTSSARCGRMDFACPRGEGRRFDPLRNPLTAPSDGESSDGGCTSDPLCA
jgi:hypothetical protein